MVPTPERRATTVKADVDDRIPTKVSLAVGRGDPRPTARSTRPPRSTTPLMVIGVEGDATTPTDHAVRLYEAARGPKALIMQRHTTHYAAYDRYWEQVTPRMVAWFDTYVRPSGVVSTHAPAPSGVETIELLEARRMSIDLRIAGGTVVTPCGRRRGRRAGRPVS